VANEQSTTTERVATRPARSRAEARAARLARREQLRRQQKAAHWRRKWLPWIIVGLLVLAGAIWFGVNAYLGAQPIPGIERYSGLSRDHLPGTIPYSQVPPPGGPHSAVWQNCGVYDEPVPTEAAVHSLEHGAVWITYRPDLPPDEVRTLRNYARGQRYVLVSPWPAEPPLPSPIVVSAWGLQLKLDSASDSRLADFVRRYANGPQTPEPGASCSGGVGTPLENW